MITVINKREWRESKNTVWFLETIEWNDTKKKFFRVWCESHGQVINETSKTMRVLSKDWKQTFGF